MIPAAWVWDDASIDDTDFLYRRIKRIPDCVMRDQLTGVAVLKPNAFFYDEGSGLSLSIGSIAEGSGATIETLTTWPTHALAYFRVEAARSRVSGVVFEPVEQDSAHGLVRVQDVDPRTWRNQWRPVRSRLMESSLYVESVEHVRGTPTEPKCISSA